jgi:NADPH:quinone reductase-like Zn-dependent oxidoreductase
VVATASPQKFDYVRNLGASEVLDYKNDQVVSRLRDLGPFNFIMSASGDPASATAISEILQPNGGRFVITRPQNDQMRLAGNVEYIYDSLAWATQKPENSAFSIWWYNEYLPAALNGKVAPTPVEKRKGGLEGIQEACDDIIAGKHLRKLVLSPNNS